MTFWDSLETPWQAAFSEGWDAYCAGSLPIGAVIINRKRKLIARGRNRIGESYGINKYISGNSLAHAELNALMQIKDDLSGQEVQLYTTVEPCPLCVGAIRMMHVGQVTFAARDPWAGSTDLFESHSYIKRQWLKVQGLPRA